MATQTQLLPALGRSNVSQPVAVEMPHIPLVNHVLSEDDMEILQGHRLRPMNLHNVVNLLTDNHSAKLYDRHLHALRKLVRHYPQGFVMKDLVTVFKILNVCADRVIDQPLYGEPIIELLKLTSQPFLKEKASDQLMYEQIAIESIAQLGYLMRVPSKEVRQYICDAVKTFYSEDNASKNIQKHQANSLAYNKMVIEKSDISETLVKSLALVEDEPENVIAILDVLQRLSKDSDENCAQMLRADAARRVCSHLDDHDSGSGSSDSSGGCGGGGGALLFKSTELLWNLLDRGSPEVLAAQLDSRECIGQLRDAFLEKLTRGYRLADRQLRNDLLVLTSLVAVIAPYAPFVETGFVRQLVLLATFQEVKSHHALVRHLKLTRNVEDFEMKKLLVTTLVTLSRDSAVIPILSEGRLLLALFSYVRANADVPRGGATVRDWTRAEFEELQLHAMSALCTLAPLMQDDYMLCHGGTRILLLLEWCVSTDEFRGDGNCFHGAGGRGNKNSQMRHCVRLLRAMVSTDNDAIAQDLVHQGAINELCNILTMMQKMEAGTATAMTVETQADMLFILSALCETDVHRKELFGMAGVEMVVEYLRMDTALLPSGLGYNHLLLTAIDCTWCAVVGCYMTEDYFLEKEGLFLLVDLLEACPQSTHNILLGCLLDLLDNAKSLSHLSSWRGHDDVSAAHLLCDVWRHEERAMGVARQPSGAISDAVYPLMGALQKQQGVTPLPYNWPSQAIVDVSENMRAKIYAIFSKIGFIELPGLMTEDHITLTIIEHYLDFKLGEVWTEVVTELDMEGVTPVTPDLEALEAICRTGSQRIAHVAQVQEELLLAQEQHELVEEQEQYAQIRETQRQRERSIEYTQDFIARTSFHPLLKAAKLRQDMAIEASRIQPNYRSLSNFHNCDLETINTTTFAGRFLKIDHCKCETAEATATVTATATATGEPSRTTSIETFKESRIAFSS